MRYSWGVAVLALATLILSSSANANVRYVGDVTPQGNDAGGGVAGANLLIGNNDLGGIFIDAAPALSDPNFITGPLESGRGNIGVGIDGVGRVELTDGRWNITDTGSLASPSLIVGDDGFGLLDLFTSSVVHVGDPNTSAADGTTVVGNGLTGQGQVTINTIASRLRTGPLVVGNEGVGSIDVNFNGSIVSTDSSLGAMSSGHGTVTLNDTSRWDLRGTLDVGFAGAPGANGHGIINLNGSSLLQASMGTSALTINPSGVVNFGGGMFRNTQGNAIANDGVMRGDGTIDSDLDIGATGELRNAAALANQRERMLVTGLVNVAGNEDGISDPNDGLIESIGGEMEFLDEVHNDGVIVARDAIMRFRGVEVSGAPEDLDNDGLLVLGGNTTIYGTIATLGVITILADSTVTVNGDIRFTESVPLVAAITSGPAAFSAGNTGGFNFSVGEDPGILTVLGDLVLDGDTVLELDYSSSTSSQAGESFQLLSADSITGEFANDYAVADGRFWDVDVMGDEVMVTATALTVGTADFNSDGRVDGLDLLEWQIGYPSIYDMDDLARWEAAYGESTAPPPAVALATVPEPSTLMLALSTLGLCCRRRD